MKNLKKLDEALSLGMRPQTSPVAIRMCVSGEEIPQEAKIPSRDLGSKIRPCEGWGLARHYGWTLAIRKEDAACGFGALYLGFLPFKQAYLEGSEEFPPFTDKKIKAKLIKKMKNLSLEYGKYEYMLLAPIRNASFKPHLVVVFGSAAQVGRLVEAAVQPTGEHLVIYSKGTASCSEVICRTMLTDECQFVFPDPAELAHAGAKDSEMIFTIPLSKIERIVKGLDTVYKLGYPLPPYLRVKTLESQVQANGFKKVMDYLWKSE